MLLRLARKFLAISRVFLQIFPAPFGNYLLIPKSPANFPTFPGQTQTVVEETGLSIFEKILTNPKSGSTIFKKA